MAKIYQRVSIICLFFLAYIERRDGNVALEEPNNPGRFHPAMNRKIGQLKRYLATTVRTVSPFS